MNETDQVNGGTTDRRSFFKHAGVAICACGVTGPGGAFGAAALTAPPLAEAAPEPLAKKWVATLLPLLAAGDRERARTMIRACWSPHYEGLGMQATVDRFRGDLPGFLRHLQAEWGWVVTHSAEQGLILIDENKSQCVCPILPKEHTGDLGLLCYCSEGFAERMFSQVVGAPVRVEVVASVLRGDKSCKYRIDTKPRNPSPA